MGAASHVVVGPIQGRRNGMVGAVSGNAALPAEYRDAATAVPRGGRREEGVRGSVVYRVRFRWVRPLLTRARRQQAL